MRQIGEPITFDDGDVGPRECLVVDNDQQRYRIKTPSGALIWIRRTSTRLTETPAHHRHRTNDRPTAVAAALNVQGITGTDKVLIALYNAGDHGLMDDEHEAINDLERDSAGKRRGEFMDGNPGLIVDTGRTRTTRRKRPAAVWMLTDAGRDHVRSRFQRGAA